MESFEMERGKLSEKIKNESILNSDVWKHIWNFPARETIILLDNFIKTQKTFYE